MRSLPTWSFAAMVLLGATSAWGQYGLYGSPAMIDLPDAGAPTSPDQRLGAYPTAPAYPSTGDYAAVPVSHTSPYARLGAPPVPASGVPRPPYGAAFDTDSELPPPDRQPSGITEQVLRESQPAAAHYGGSPHFGSVISRSGCSSGAGCGVDCGFCLPPAPPWYVRGRALFMGRDKANSVWLTRGTDESPELLAHSWSSHPRWVVGGEVTVGRRFFAGDWALEGTYWGLENFRSSLFTSQPAGVSTTLHLNDEHAEAFFNGARQHQFRRQNELHNVEINLLRGNLTAGYHKWDIELLSGVRFFRFNEDFLFGSRQGDSWVDAEAAYLETRLRNSLVGYQIGVDSTYRITDTLSFFAVPKIGIYNNHIRQTVSIHRGDGAEAPGFPVGSRQDDVAFLSQIDLGLDWQFTQRWSANIGYRAVIATGMALADHQIPHYFVDLPELYEIKNNGHLVVHGAFAGATLRF